MVHIAIRLDDITPDMDWERFLKFKEILDQYQVKPLLGVVPENQDLNLKGNKTGAPEDFWGYIKELQKEGWTVAMHGYRHIYTTQKGGMFPLNDLSEFAGVPYQKQLQMLQEGKRMLEEKGIFTDIFMAPAHSYDKNTLTALKNTGFRELTDGFGSRPYRWKGLIFYPISFKLSRTFQKQTGYSTMVVHTGTIQDHEWEGYENYLKKNSVQWIDYREYLEQPAADRNRAGMVLEFMMACLKHYAAKLLR